MNILDTIGKEQMKDDVTPFNVGDTVKVHCRVIEGGKERVQIFQGIVIAKRGAGINEAFTVRKIAYGEGVERSFPIHTPKIAKIEVVTRGKVRRAKLHYLRSRVGKEAVTVKTIRSSYGTTPKLFMTQAIPLRNGLSCFYEVETLRHNAPNKQNKRPTSRRYLSSESNRQ